MGVSDSSDQKTNSLACLAGFVKIYANKANVDAGFIKKIVKDFYYDHAVKRVASAAAGVGKDADTVQSIKKRNEEYYKQLELRVANQFSRIYAICNEAFQTAIKDIKSFRSFAQQSNEQSFKEFADELVEAEGCIRTILSTSKFLFKDDFLGKELNWLFSEFIRTLKEDIKGKVLTIFRLQSVSDNKILDKSEAGNTLSMRDDETKKNYGPFYKIIPGGGTQHDVYSSIQSTLALSRYHCVLFGYGASGSGKTFTLYGKAGNEGVVKKFFEGQKNVRTRLFAIGLKRESVKEVEDSQIEIVYTIKKIKDQSFGWYTDVTETGIMGTALVKKGATKPQRVQLTAGGLSNFIKNSPRSSLVKWTPNNPESTRCILVFEYTWRDNGTGPERKMTVIDLPGIEDFNESGFETFATRSLKFKSKIDNGPGGAGAKIRQIITKAGKGSSRSDHRFNGHGIFKPERKGVVQGDSKNYPSIHIEDMIFLMAESFWINKIVSAGKEGIAEFLFSRQKKGTDAKLIPYVVGKASFKEPIGYFSDYLLSVERNSKKSNFKVKYVMFATSFDSVQSSRKNAFLESFADIIRKSTAKKTLEFAHRFASTSKPTEIGPEIKRSDTAKTSYSRSELMHRILNEFYFLE